MGLIKDRHGTYHAQQKVPLKPQGLQEAVAKVLGKGKPRQTHLKKSLGTKDLKTVNVRAKPVQMEFDRIMRGAQALLDTKPRHETACRQSKSIGWRNTFMPANWNGTNVSDLGDATN